MVGKVVHFRNRKSSGVFSHAAFYFPDNIKANSKPLRPSRRKLILPKTPDILNVPTFTAPISLIDTMPLSVNQPIDMLPDIFAMSDNSSDESMPHISTKIQQLPHMNQMVKLNLLSFSEQKSNLTSKRKSNVLF